MKQVIRETTVADRVLLVLLIALSLAGLVYSREAVSSSPEVVIEKDGKTAYVFSLASERTVSVEGPYGPTIVQIKGGRVRIREAGCPNLNCVKEGWISRGVIVCLPNRIVITVGGSSSSDPRGIDAVTG